MPATLVEMGYSKVNKIRIPSIATLGLIAFMAGGAQAQEIDHIHLSKSDTLLFPEILEQAMLQSPAYREIAARSEEAKSYENVGQSWIAGRPSVQLDYLDDRSLTNNGQTELTYGVALPLWRPGERDQIQTLGQNYSAQTSDWQRRFALDTAGKVRSSLADLHEAETLLALEQQATADAKELLRIVEALFNAGEVAALDVMQARNLLLAQQRNELDADAMVVDAERSYAVLTGLTVAPGSPHTETRIAAEEVAPDHPLLQFLQSSIDLQDSNIRKAESIAKGNPTLTLGSRRQKTNTYADYENALAISVSIPFGGKSFVSAAGSTARRAKVDAEVEYFTSLRELNAQLHEVEHQLFTLDQSLPLSEEQAALSRQQWDMARNAFELGETDMSRVVVAMQQARASSKEYETLSMQYQRLISESNQIIGVLP
jgi:cobalt-zinc-cadmium efflux system outer membrane protein